MIIVTRKNFPALRDAFEAIEVDNGGHHVGTTHPGTPIDMERFEIPDSHVALLAPAEASLARLRAQSQDDWDTFVTGECSEAEAIEERQGDLAPARQLLNDWFNDWQEG
jgi:hypothetical protein